MVNKDEYIIMQVHYEFTTGTSPVCGSGLSVSSQCKKRVLLTCSIRQRVMSQSQ